MSEHTPGEWAARNQDGVWSVGIPAARQLLAKIPAGSIDCEANARLIAAAPALLGACKELVEALGDIWYGTPEESEPVDVEEIIEQARAAIAKAEAHDDPR